MADKQAEAKKYIAIQEKFMKDAFCISGEVKFVRVIEIEDEDYMPIKAVLYKLTDAKRGTFYVTMGK